MNTDGMPVNIGDVFIKKTEYWIIRRKITGLNGYGLPWIEEQWNWPTGGTCRTETLTLDLETWRKMLGEFNRIEAGETIGRNIQ